MDDTLQGSDINQVPDLQPVELPNRDNAPTIEDRIAQIEGVLKINP